LKLITLDATRTPNGTEQRANIERGDGGAVSITASQFLCQLAPTTLQGKDPHG
jgi:hypothetical protein